MLRTLRCDKCNTSLRPQESVCSNCGEHVSETHDVRRGTAPLEWLDGQGRAWVVEADEQRLSLSTEGEHHHVARPDWDSALSLSPLGRNAVFRVDLGDREVGFMAPRHEVDRLLAAMRWPDADPAPSRAERTPEPEPAAARGGPIWPKMLASPIIAVFLASLAFLPVIGVAFGLAAAGFAWWALRKGRRNAAFLHVRIVAKISLVIAGVGVAISALSTYAFMQQDLDSAASYALLIGTNVEWSIGAIAAALVMVVVGLSFHEAAHAISAWWCGDDYARSLGRVTLSPLAHIDPFGTVLLPILLAYYGMPIFGYAKPVPVLLAGVRRFRRAHILISAAGPASNLLQAAICMGLLMLMGSILSIVGGNAEISNFSSLQPIVEIEGIAGGRILAGLALMLKVGFQINVILAFFNLIPVPPLDGSWILEHLFPNTLGRLYAAIRPAGFLIFLGLLWWGALDWLLYPAIVVHVEGLQLLGAVTGL